MVVLEMMSPSTRSASATAAMSRMSSRVSCGSAPRRRVETQQHSASTREFGGSVAGSQAQRAPDTENSWFRARLF
jgi:hypothetical protein